MQHTLFVVDDDVRGLQVLEAAQTVVAVDDAAVEVVEVAGRETAAVQLHHRAQVRGDDRDGIQHHRRGRFAGLEEGVDDLQTLQGAGFLLPGLGFDDFLQGLGFAFQVERHQAVLYRLGAHSAFEVGAVQRVHLAVQDLVAFQVAHLQGLEFFPNLVVQLQVGFGLVAQRLHFFFGSAAYLVDFGLFPAFLFEGRHLFFHALGAFFDVEVAVLFDQGARGVGFLLHIGEVLVAAVLVHPRNHVGGEVNHLFEVLRCEVQEVPESRGYAFEVPDMGNRRGQLDVAHALAAHRRAGNLYAASFTDDALVTHALVLSARALPVLGGAKDPFVEQAFFLWLQGAVVDGFRFLHLAIRPGVDVVLSRQTDPELVELIRIQHIVSLSFSSWSA